MERMTKLLKTERLEIKPFSQEDRVDLAGLLLNEEIKKTYMLPDFATEEALNRMVNVFMNASVAENHFTRGIYRENRLIGFVNDVEINEGRAEFGYVIHPSFWGQGYATEMFRAVIEELLGKPFSTIRAGAFRENSASLRVLEKCGMQKCPQTEEIEYQGATHTCIYYEIHKA